MQLPKTSAPGHSRHPPDNRTETVTETASPEYGHAARWHARSREFRILTEILDDAFHAAGTIAVRTLDLEEALEWLDEVAPTLRSVVSEKESTDPSSRGSTQVQYETSSAPVGWLTVRQAFSIRYEKVMPDELEEKVDDFYAWLKASLQSGEVELRRDGDETYLRILL